VNINHTSHKVLVKLLTSLLSKVQPTTSDTVLKKITTNTEDGILRTETVGIISNESKTLVHVTNSHTVTVDDTKPSRKDGVALGIDSDTQLRRKIGKILLDAIQDSQDSLSMRVALSPRRIRAENKLTLASHQAITERTSLGNTVNEGLAVKGIDWPREETSRVGIQSSLKRNVLTRLTPTVGNVMLTSRHTVTRHLGLTSGSVNVRHQLLAPLKSRNVVSTKGTSLQMSHTTDTGLLIRRASTDTEVVDEERKAGLSSLGVSSLVQILVNHLTILIGTSSNGGSIPSTLDVRLEEWHDKRRESALNDNHRHTTRENSPLRLNISPERKNTTIRHNQIKLSAIKHTGPNVSIDGLNH
jgi:hypothetical protein